MGLRPLSDYEYLNISVRGSTLAVSISIDKNGELKLTQSERLTFISGGPRVVVSTAACHARVRGSVPGLGVFKETKCFFPIHV